MLGMPAIRERASEKPGQGGKERNKKQLTDNFAEGSPRTFDD